MNKAKTHSQENRDVASLLAWVESELAFHEETMESIGVDDNTGEVVHDELDAICRVRYREHNEGAMRMCQIRAALISGSVLRYWHATPSPDVPELIKERKDWPEGKGGVARDLWANIPIVI